jgi:hypothetical protein
MKTHVIRGSKQEIVERLVQITGEVREAIVFEEDSAAISANETNGAEDIFAEMRPFMVDMLDVDDSREAIYTRLDGE